MATVEAISNGTEFLDDLFDSLGMFPVGFFSSSRGGRVGPGENRVLDFVVL